jgi:hypothetical protein
VIEDSGEEVDHLRFVPHFASCLGRILVIKTDTQCRAARRICDALVSKAEHLLMQLEGRSIQWRDPANQAQLPHVLTFQRSYSPYHSVQGLQIGKSSIPNALHNLCSTAKEQAVRFECQLHLGKLVTDLCPMAAGDERSALIGGSMTSKRRALKLKISSTASSKN